MVQAEVLEIRAPLALGDSPPPSKKERKMRGVAKTTGSADNSSLGEGVWGPNLRRDLPPSGAAALDFRPSVNTRREQNGPAQLNTMG